jgi:hypothetical protein
VLIFSLDVSKFAGSAQTSSDRLLLATSHYSRLLSSSTTDTKQCHFLLTQHRCVLEQGRCCAHIRRMVAGIDKRVEPFTNFLVFSAHCKSTRFDGDLHEEQLRRVCVVNISCIYIIIVTWALPDIQEPFLVP